MTALRHGLGKAAGSKAGCALVALAVALVAMGPNDAAGWLVVTENEGNPATSLVMPFDVTANRTTTLIVSSALSHPGNRKMLSTHWTFWSARGDLLEDVSICLLPGDTAVVDPRNLFSADQANDQVGPTISLAGYRGLVTVTAYVTDELCSPGDVTGLRMADWAIIGSFSIQAGTTTLLANGAVGFGRAWGADGNDFGDLPESLLRDVELHTLKPDALAISTVTILALRERGGAHGWANEIGPLKQRVSARPSFIDNTAVATPLPDLSLRAMLFTRIKPGAGSLIPAATEVQSAGLLRLSNLKSGGVFEVQRDIGYTTWVVVYAGSITPSGAAFQIMGRY